MKKILLIAAFLIVAPFAAHAETLKVDVVHSSVTFKVRHFFSNVNGKFGKFNVKLDFDAANLEKSKVEARIFVASVDTNNKKRDGHLQNADFFDAPKHPRLIFKSTAVKKTGDNTMDIMGDLTIRGITKSVVLKAAYNGSMKNPQTQKTHHGFTATLTINRHDFKVSYGKGIVGADVTISLDIAAIGK